MAPTLLVLYYLLSGFAEIAGATRWRPRHISNPIGNSLGNPRGLRIETNMGTRNFDIGVGVRDSAVEIDSDPRDTITHARKTRRRKPKQQLRSERAPPKKAPPKKAAPPKKVTPPKKAPKKAAPPKKTPKKAVPSKKATPSKKARPGKSNDQAKPAKKTKKPAIHEGAKFQPRGGGPSVGSSSGSSSLIMNIKADDNQGGGEVVAPIVLDIKPEDVDKEMKPTPKKDEGKTEEKGKGK